MRRLTTLVLILAGCARTPVAGPSVSWAMYQDGLEHNAVLTSTFPAVAWNLKLAGKNNAGFGYDGTLLYADDFAHELLAIDPRNGHVVWRAHADDVLMSTPIVAAGMVYVGSGTNDILTSRRGMTVWGRPQGNHWYAFREDDGAPVWSYPTRGEAMPSAAYVDGRLIFATGDDVATEVDARTGATIWKTTLPGVPTMGSAMVSGGTVFVTATKGKPDWNDPARSHTLAIDVGTGRVLWSSPVGNGDCTPTVAQGLVFVEDEHDGPAGPLEPVGTNVVAALDARTGALRWEYHSAAGLFTSVGTNERAITGTYVNGVLYQSLPAVDQIVAFSASDGRVLWRARTSAPVKMSPVIVKSTLYAGDTVGVLYALDVRNGAIEAAWPFAKPFTAAPPLVLGETMFLSETDTVHAFPLHDLLTGVGS
jgi:outer membrane protein assembly factor BamB